MHALQAASGTTLSTSLPSRRARARAVGARVRVFGTFGGVLALGYATDQLTKWWAEQHLVRGEPRPLIGSLLKLHLTYNPGAAFSMGTGATWVLTVVACAVVVFVIWTSRRLRSTGWALALGLLLAGALGNLTDRWFRSPGPGRGHVVDFLRLPHWPIFNVADICVVTAACLICLLVMRDVPLGARPAPPEGRNHG